MDSVAAAEIAAGHSPEDDSRVSRTADIPAVLPGSGTDSDTAAPFAADTAAVRLDSDTGSDTAARAADTAAHAFPGTAAHVASTAEPDTAAPASRFPAATQDVSAVDAALKIGASPPDASAAVVFAP